MSSPPRCAEPSPTSSSTSCCASMPTPSPTTVDTRSPCAATCGAWSTENSRSTRMRTTARIATAAIAVGALIVPLAACGSSEPEAADGEVTIDFFHRWPNEPKNAYFADLVSRFEEENPDIKVNVESVLNDAYKDKVKVVAGSANAPDVMFSWSGSFLEELAKGDALMDLGPWLAENPELTESF